MRDLFSRLKGIRGISPQIQTNLDTAFVSQIIDRQGFDSLTFFILLGALTDAGVTFVVLVEDADEVAFNVTNAAVADKYLLGTEALAGAFTQADDNKVAKIGYRGPKRYVRLTITPTGNAAGDINIAALALLGHPSDAPLTTQLV
jgi:hypothetical protein